MKTIVIIQARMGSSRLPGKILMPLAEEDNLTYVVERCRKIDGVSEVIVATSVLEQDDVVEKWCEEQDVLFYRGSEEDVLSRFIQVAKLYNPDYIIRVTADCPFLDYEMASEMVQLMAEKQVEIIDLANASELPRGLAVEIISHKALMRIDEKGKQKRHREHVTYYANEFKKEFTRENYFAKKGLLNNDLRITLDTNEDYKVISTVANYFNDKLVRSSDVVTYLNENPQIAKLNAHIEQKPVI